MIESSSTVAWTHKKILKVLWWLHRHLVGWQAALARKGVATQDVDLMDDWEDRYQQIIDSYKEDYRENELPKVREQLAEFEEEFDKKWVDERKMGYLDSEIAKENTKLSEAYRENQQLAKRDVPYWFRSLLLEDTLKTSKGLKKHTFEKRLILYPQQENKKGVSLEQIAKARDFPFEQLIELGRNNMTKCPFHIEKTASFLVKNNWGYCFGCAWSGDILAFVMERDKKGFVETVKSLI